MIESETNKYLKNVFILCHEEESATELSKILYFCNCRIFSNEAELFELKPNYH